MNTQETLAFLQAKYPKLNWYTIPSIETASDFEESYISTLNLPQEIIYFEFNDTAMYDAYSSQCSRFPESPRTYGLSEKNAQLLSQHNKIKIH